MKARFNAVGRMARGAALLAVLVFSRDAVADRKDQVAANLYRNAVTKVEKRQYREAVGLLQEVLARGATEPNEAQGSEFRFQETRFDPYYWLGVAHMELGEDEEAWLNLARSERHGVVRRWKAEWADLTRRKELLAGRLAVAAPSSAPTAVPASRPDGPEVGATGAAAPEPTPALPPEPPPQVSAPTAPHGPSRAALAVEPAAARARVTTSPAAGVPEVLGRGLRERLVREPALSDRGRLLASTLGAGLGEPISGLYAAVLDSSLVALRRHGWDDARRLLELARELRTGAPEPDLVEAVSLATRYLLEGSRDPQLRQEARGRYGSWRARQAGGLPRLVSPAVARVLQ